MTTTTNTTTTTIADALRAGIELLSSSREWFGDIDGSVCEELTAALRQYDDVIDKLRAALHEAERAEQVEPAAYRVEIRWRDRALDQSWRKYADTAYQDSAISLRDSENNMETESRIVPLYAGEPEESR